MELGVVIQDEFDRQLRKVKSRFGVLHLETFADLVEGGEIPNRGSVLITVADGFQNLLDYAVPVAGKMKVPLLAFASTSHLDGGP